MRFINETFRFSSYFLKLSKDDFTLNKLWCLMDLTYARKNCLLVREDGSIIYPLSKFLTDGFNNPQATEDWRVVAITLPSNAKPAAVS